MKYGEHVWEVLCSERLSSLNISYSALVEGNWGVNTNNLIHTVVCAQLKSKSPLWLPKCQRAVKAEGWHNKLLIFPKIMHLRWFMQPIQNFVEGNFELEIWFMHGKKLALAPKRSYTWCLVRERTIRTVREIAELHPKSWCITIFEIAVALWTLVFKAGFLVLVYLIPMEIQLG